MIRVNLLPFKRKKKRKPLPTFLIFTVLITLGSLAVMGYLFYYFNSRLNETKAQFEANKKKIAELKEKIKEVENFEKLNKSFQDKTQLIEQLRRNQNVPVMILDEISRKLPNGVWLSSMTVSGGGLSFDGYAFSNSDVVAYVDSLKDSKAFAEIFLQESRQEEKDKIPVFHFKITLKVTI